MRKDSLYAIRQVTLALLTIPVAIVLRRPGWRWFFVEIGRAIYPFANLLKVPIVSLTDIYPDMDLDIGDKGGGRIKVVYAGYWSVGLSPLEQFIMANLVSYLRPGTVFEIGTAFGSTTLLIAQNVGETTKIFTMDLPPDNSFHRLGDNVGSAFRGTEYEKQITLLLGDSQRFDFAPCFKKIDLIFVDGAHDYDSVRVDSENARRRLSQNGVILWHDYPGAAGVQRAVNEFARSYGATYMIRGTHFALYAPTRKSVFAKDYRAPDRDPKYHTAQD